MIAKMKTYRILSVVLLAAGLVSCSNKVEFKDVPFVAFDNASINVKEDVGSINIGVTAYSFTEPFSLTFEKVDGKAIEGDSYEIVDNDARVLRFTPENPTQTIIVDVVNKEGVTTGAVDFTINLLTATGEEITLAANTVCSVSIADNDVPVNWDYIVGEWNASDFGGPKYTVEIKQIDETTLILHNLWQGGLDIEGTITFDEENNTASIAFAAKQVVANHSSYGPMGIYGLTPDGSKLVDPATAFVTNAKFELGPWLPLILTGDYAGYSLTGQEGFTYLSK